tara:strand:+ start:1563 stop:2390 length:828 start_codon:yes stop_codon:yes gene_type:complete
MNYIKEKFINLSGKTIIVTGANGQIGLSLVKKLAQYNAKIVAVDLKVNNINKIKQDNKITESNILILKSDIKNVKEVKKIFLNAKKKFNSVNSLVCNAGVAVFENYLKRTEKSLDKVINVNIKGTFYCIREFINHHDSKLGEGTIVNVASHYGLISPDPRIYIDTNRASSEIYGASKAAIIQMTKYFAVHAIKKNIRTNSVSPGGIADTDNVLGKKVLQKIKQGLGFREEYSKRCPMARLAKINEVVDPILFLLSSSSSYINGHNLVIDGGYSIW